MAIHAQTMKNMQKYGGNGQQPAMAKRQANGIILNQQSRLAPPIVNTRVVDHKVRQFDVGGLDVLGAGEDDLESVITIPQNDQFL